MKFQSTISLLLLTFLVGKSVFSALPYKPNELLIKTTKEIPLTWQKASSSSGTELDPFLKKYPVKKLEKLPEARSLKVSSSKNMPEEPQLYRLVFSEPTINIFEAINDFSKVADVIAVQPNFVYQATFEPNDPDLTWGLGNANVYETWDFCTGNASVSMAIIDTGISSNHPDLSYVAAAWNFTDNTSNAEDAEGHGTHVAGIAGAQFNNRMGSAGVAPGCVLWNLKAGNSEGFYTFNLLKALDYVIEHKASVVNLSFGAFEDLFSQTQDTLFKEKIAQVIQANIPIVASAGNDRTNISQRSFIPACLPQVIAVSAVQFLDAFDSSYSNYGDRIDLAAPGTNIYSTYSSTQKPNTYAYMTGTSMAAPFVTGTIGLLKSASPNLTVAQIYQILTASALDLGNSGKDSLYGYGLVDAKQALLALSTNSPQIIHEPLASFEDGHPVVIAATISDNLAWKNYPIGKVIYRYFYQGKALQTWQTVTMNKSANSYSVQIPISSKQSNELRYYIVAQSPKFTTKLPIQGEVSPFSIKANQSAPIPDPSVENQTLNITGPNQGPVINAPNPFNPLKEPTYICFELNQNAEIEISLYSLNLQLVKHQIIQSTVGYHEIPWDGREQSGDFVPNGVYVCIVKASAGSQKMMKRFKIAVLR